MPSASVAGGGIGAGVGEAEAIDDDARPAVRRSRAGLAPDIILGCEEDRVGLGANRHNPSAAIDNQAIADFPKGDNGTGRDSEARGITAFADVGARQCRLRLMACANDKAALKDMGAAAQTF